MTVSPFYVQGQRLALTRLDIKEAGVRDIAQIIGNAIKSAIPERFLPKAEQTALATRRALAEAPLPLAEQARFNAVNEWINTQRIPPGWRVTSEGLSLEPLSNIVTPRAIPEVLRKTATASPFAQLNKDPFHEIQRRTEQAYNIEMPQNDIGKELGRMFKNPLAGLRLNRG